jgi:hypothetical protein
MAAQRARRPRSEGSQGQPDPIRPHPPAQPELPELERAFDPEGPNARSLIERVFPGQADHRANARSIVHRGNPAGCNRTRVRPANARSIGQAASVATRADRTPVRSSRDHPASRTPVRSGAHDGVQVARRTDVRSLRERPTRRRSEHRTHVRHSLADLGVRLVENVRSLPGAVRPVGHVRRVARWHGPTERLFDSRHDGVGVHVGATRLGGVDGVCLIHGVSLSPPSTVSSNRCSL